MKRVATFITAALLVISTWAQTPQKMSYQAVIRDANSSLVVNQQVGMQISILQTTADGSVVYTETQTPTTNANGLISIEIGSEAGFESIDWSADIYFLKTETDPAGGTNYSITGTSQLLSVPYALNAKIAESLSEPINESDPVYTAWDKDYSDLSNTPNIVDTIHAVIDTTTKFIREEVDGDSSNELQNLTYSDNSLSIDKGNSVIINESKWTTSGNSILYNGGQVGIGITTSPAAMLDIYDNIGYSFFRFVSEDNIYTQWISNRAGVHDYQLGIDGGNNKFIFANTTTGNFPLVFHDDKIGINTLEPEASLHITDFMKLEPRSTAPSSPTKGMIYYDDTDNKLKVYTGSVWENLN